MPKLESSSKVKSDFPQCGGTGYARERKENPLDQKLQGKFEKRNRNIAYIEGMAEDAKVDDGDKSRLRRALKQLRKDREEERPARELLDEAQERAPESERSFCREVDNVHVLMGQKKLEDHTTSERKSGK